MSIILCSFAFNVAFYVCLLGYLIAALPTYALPRRYLLGLCRSWARTNFWLLRTICNIKVEFRGTEKIPPGALIVASKHQSAWETFGLMVLFPDFTYILKRELQWIPIFGWYTIKARMIPVDRGGGASAVSAMLARAHEEIGDDRQLLIFPEGTRRPVGAEPRYKSGVAQLYAECGAPCLPVALNSGLFWPRRTFRRYPGTIRVEILDPIAPGLSRSELMDTLRERIEDASSRLAEDGRRELQAIGIAPRMAADASGDA